MEKLKPFAISVSDGHNEDWYYFDNETDCLTEFEKLKEVEDDIHVYKLVINHGVEEYEVFESYWIGEN